MKKVLTTLMFAVALFAAVPLQAQVKFGLKGGLNVTNMSLSKEVFDTSNKTGFFVGPTIKVTLPIVGLGIDASALYDQRDAKIGGEDGSEKVSLRSINVPVNVRYGIGLGSMASIYLAAGPQFGYNIGDKNVFGYVGEEGEHGGFSLKKSNLSINVGVGVSLMSKFEIGATYNIACGKTGEFSVINAGKEVFSKSSRMNAWQVSAAYYF